MEWNTTVATLSGLAYGLAFVAMGTGSFYAQAGIVGALFAACIGADLVLAGRTAKSAETAAIAPVASS